MGILKHTDVPPPTPLRPRIFAVIGFVLFTNLFFFHNTGSLAHVLLHIGLSVLFLFLFWPTVVSCLQKKRLWLYAGTFLFALMGILWRASGFPTMILQEVILVTLVLFLYECAASLKPIASLMEVVMLPFSLLNEYIRGMSTGMAHLWKQSADKPLTKGPSRYRRMLFSIAIGIVLGLPAVVILAVLFSQADPVFSAAVRHITAQFQQWFAGAFWERLLIRSILSGFLFCLFLPFLFFLRRSFRSPLPSFTSHRFIVELSIALLMVIITIGAFLVIQWPYVFATVPFETDLSQFGVATYSEYVNRGFDELIIVSLFLYLGSWIIHMLTREQPFFSRRGLRVFQLVLLGEFVILVLSIFRRVYLYQSYHGWSLARIYGCFALIWISMLCLTFSARLFTKRSWVQIEIVMTGALLLFAGWWNAEAFIVRAHPPTVNKRVDYVYLSRMSADGTDGWKKALDYATTTLLDPHLAQKPLLDREDRRRIAYAGTVVNNLTWEYDRLMHWYATPTEKEQYYNVMLSPTLLRTEEPSATLSAQLIASGSSSSAEKQRLYESVHLMYWAQHVSFNTYTKGTFMYYGVWPIDYHLQRPYLSGGEPDALDRFFRWNAAEASAYRFVQRDMSPEKLVALQESFYRLFDKILTQPDTERAYEQDISFDSPFLD